MAVKVITSSQPSTHARIQGVYCIVADSLAVLSNNDWHGQRICGPLITCGDSALNNYVVYLRGKAEGRALYAAVMQSMPTMATNGVKSMWLGDTGAGMHCITDAALAVKGSLRPNTTLIVTANGTTKPKYRCDVMDIPLRKERGSAEHQTEGRAGARQRITQPHQPRALGNGGSRRTSRGGNDWKVNAVPTKRTRGPAAQRGRFGGTCKQRGRRSIASSCDTRQPQTRRGTQAAPTMHA
eukprot:6179842-Pleurochrysis_carterae.AAC.6